MKSRKEMTPEEREILRVVEEYSPYMRSMPFFVIGRLPDPTPRPLSKRDKRMGLLFAHVPSWYVWVYKYRDEEGYFAFGVEDHGTHYRVRGGDRSDKWETVQKLQS